MFDAVAWMDEEGIPYSLTGKNISSNWFGLTCCFCDDISTHLGISPDGEFYSCFRCGTRGNILNLIKEITNSSYSKAKEIYLKYSNILNIPDYINEGIERVSRVEWPPELVSSKPLRGHELYLKKRNYDIDHLIQNYGIQFGGFTGDFSYRIIIPVHLNGKVVSYIGRDITNKAYLRYKNLSEKKSVLPVKETVYNIDAIHDEAIICEGCLDAWRFGYNAVALFGLVYTQKQIRMLGDKLRKAYICFDNEPQAEEAAEQLAEELSWQGVSTEVLLIDKADPGELSKEEADEIKQELFGNKELVR